MTKDKNKGNLGMPCRTNEKLPTELEDEKESMAPYTVRCSSMTGVVWRISGTLFYN